VELSLIPLVKESRERAMAIADQLLFAAAGSVGESQDELEAAFGAVHAEARDTKLKEGMKKLIADRCKFDSADGLAPDEVRRELFTLASSRRAALGPGEKLDRAALLQEVATQRGIPEDALERAMFSDLRGAQILRGFEALPPDALVDLYERGQAQAVLLRAVRITVDLVATTAGAARTFFRKLKFLRLLHVISKKDEGYQVVIDGPFSMFESVTKYGLQLALVLPALEGCDAWRLSADVRWGKEKRPLVFRLEGGAPRSGRVVEPPLPDEVEALRRSFVALRTPWKVSTRATILDLPGVGLTVPDLVFEQEVAGGKPVKVYLEVMGYWSRDAVWKRVELVQAGLRERILFALSTRLRVSEEVLGDDVPGALYVYKGTMSARVIAERLEALRIRS